MKAKQRKRGKSCLQIVFDFVYMLIPSRNLFETTDKKTTLTGWVLLATGWLVSWFAASPLVGSWFQSGVTTWWIKSVANNSLAFVLPRCAHAELSVHRSLVSDMVWDACLQRQTRTTREEKLKCCMLCTLTCCKTETCAFLPNARNVVPFGLAQEDPQGIKRAEEMALVGVPKTLRADLNCSFHNAHQTYNFSNSEYAVFLLYASCAWWPSCLRMNYRKEGTSIMEEFAWQLIESKRFEAVLQLAGSADRWGTWPLAIEFLFFATTSLSSIVEHLLTVSVQTVNRCFQAASLLLRFKHSLQHVACDMFAPHGSSNFQFCFCKQKPKETEEGQTS